MNERFGRSYYLFMTRGGVFHTMFAAEVCFSELLYCQISSSFDSEVAHLSHHGGGV